MRVLQVWLQRVNMYILISGLSLPLRVGSPACGGWRFFLPNSNNSGQDHIPSYFYRLVIAVNKAPTIEPCDNNYYYDLAPGGCKHHVVYSCRTLISYRYSQYFVALVYITLKFEALLRFHLRKNLLVAL